MRKRILLVETNDVTRSVMESTLRQNGYEVIAVTSAEKTLEVLKFTRPDLLVVGADLEAADQKPLYSQLQKNKDSKGLPLLLIDSADGNTVSLPDEVIIRRPVDPQDFIQKVTVCLTPIVGDETPRTNPLATSNLSEEFLDVALGLDQIDVTASEDMDKTNMKGSKKKKPTVESLVGLESANVDDSDVSHQSRVESLVIENDDSEIRRDKKPTKTRPVKSGTGKLELATDQYGLSGQANLESAPSDNPDDYSSFLSSLKEDTDSKAGRVADVPPDTGGLYITQVSSLVDPFSPASTTTPQSHAKTSSDPSGVGVEKFIDEFKKEIEQLRSNDPVEGAEDGTRSVVAGEDATLDWQDSIETIDEQQVALFTRQFASELAERVATKIVERIDSAKLMQMLKSAIIEQGRKK